MKTVLRRIQGLTLENLVRFGRRMLRNEQHETIYRIAAAEAIELPVFDDFGRDRWEDLLLFPADVSNENRDELLRMWRQRLADGLHVFTKICNGRLGAYGWMHDRQKVSATTAGQPLILPDNSAVIFNFYTLPEFRNTDFYSRLLMHALHEAAAVSGTEWIYAGVPLDHEHRVPKWWVDRLGMTPYETYHYRRTLWIRKTWCTAGE